MIVLATILTMTHGLAHNVEQLMPKPPGPPVARRDSVAAYDEAVARCLSRPFGSTTCRLP